MNTPKRSVGRRLVAALGAAAIGLVGLAGAANADDGTTTTETGNIDFNQPRSIVVHKYSQPVVSGSAATGEKQTPGDGAEPIDGVTFQACKVLNLGADDTNNWQKVDKATVNEQGQVTIDSEPVTPESDDCVTQVTVGGGKATFSDLDAALYVVTETDPGSNPIAERSAPFLVTVPMPNATKTDWLYTVYAYPKNVLVGQPTKTVEDGQAHIDGDVVTWTITATVPNLIAGKPLTELAVADILDPRLTLVDEDDAVTVTVNGEAFNDFSLETTTPLTVRFTAPSAFDSRDVIVVTVRTKVHFPASTDTGAISNTATLIVNDAEVPSAPAVTDWGTLKVSKTDAQSSSPLSGAEFNVCLDEECDSQVTTFTSGDGGNASLALKAGTYYLVETKAPAGYTLDSTPRVVVVEAGTAAAARVERITNTKQSVPALPLTGANGQLLALIGGGALVLLAGGTALVARKRSHQKQD